MTVTDIPSVEWRQGMTYDTPAEAATPAVQVQAWLNVNGAKLLDAYYAGYLQADNFPWEREKLRVSVATNGKAAGVKIRSTQEGVREFLRSKHNVTGADMPGWDQGHIATMLFIAAQQLVEA